jgi:hypothetical protein
MNQSVESTCTNLLSLDMPFKQLTKKHHARSATEIAAAETDVFQKIDLSDINNDVCDEVAGNTRAGKFLAKLIRWYRYTKVKRAGHKWVTLTHAEWAVETALTLDQIRRILTRLGAAGLIVRSQHIFKNRTVLFLRPSNACLKALLAAVEVQRTAKKAQAAAKAAKCPT